MIVIEHLLISCGVIFSIEESHVFKLNLAAVGYSADLNIGALSKATAATVVSINNDIFVVTCFDGKGGSVDLLHFTNDCNRLSIEVGHSCCVNEGVSLFSKGFLYVCHFLLI